MQTMDDMEGAGGSGWETAGGSSGGGGRGSPIGTCGMSGSIWWM
jgi:hypothetical protein